MMKTLLRFALPVVLVGTLCAALLVGADPAAVAEKRYGRMPWHLVDVWWDIGRNEPFESYSMDVEFSNDVPTTVNLYVAPIGWAMLGKNLFYGGIQTQVDGHTRKSRRIRRIGPGFLMSMWGERSLDAIRPSVGGYCQSSGHEGDFISVRRAYAWSKGKYTYKVVRMDTEQVAGKPHTWVGAFVYSHQKDENVFVGALRFKGEKLVLSRRLASFVEVYGPRRPAGEIPKVTVTLDNLRINGKAVQKPTATATYVKGVPDYAEAVAKGRAVVITVGQPVKNRTTRSVKLDLK